jgi:hypothetical protein
VFLGPLEFFKWRWMPLCLVHMLRIDISSWWIFPLINMKWPSLSLLTDFNLHSTLPDISVAMPACLWGPFAWRTFFHPLTLSQCLLFFQVRWVSFNDWVWFLNSIWYSMTFDWGIEAIYIQCSYYEMPIVSSHFCSPVV